MERYASLLERFFIVFVLAVAVLGVVLHSPGRVVASHQGVEIALAVLVATTGLSLQLDRLVAVKSSLVRIGLTVLGSSIALPAISFLSAQLATSPHLRYGILAAGVAPAEVASVALCSLAGGEAAITASILILTTVLTVFISGPILVLEGAHVTGSSTSLLVNLALVVGAPLLIGIGIQIKWHLEKTGLAMVRITAVLSLLVLIWLVASQVVLNRAYLQVTVALLAYLAGSALLGVLLSLRLPRSKRRAIMLPVTMRDFAIAAGIAAAAFGPAAAAPLGAYGVAVLLFGAAIAAYRPGRSNSAPLE